MVLKINENKSRTIIGVYIDWPRSFSSKIITNFHRKYIKLIIIKFIYRTFINFFLNGCFRQTKIKKNNIKFLRIIYFKTLIKLYFWFNFVFRYR